MSFSDRLAGLAPHAVAVLLIGAAVHLVAVLAMPRLAARDAFARIAAVAPVGDMTALTSGRAAAIPKAGDAAADLLPGLDPASALAACRYDLALGPLKLRAAMEPDRFVSLSFHSRHGAIYYALTDRAASRGKLDVVVLDARQLEKAEAQENEDEPNQDLRLIAPEREGFVLVRALARDSGAMDEAQARLKAVSCEVVRE